MNTIIPLLTTFTGRISRREWWIGFVIVLIGSIAGTLLFNPEMLTSEVVVPPQWPDTIWQLAWLVPATAITVKRFNDRNWPWWLGYAFGVLGVFLYVAPHFGMVLDPEAGGVDAVAFWVLLAAIVAAVVDNGFFRGTRGPNRSGPDPLAGAPQSA